jgi:hypothetical protein
MTSLFHHPYCKPYILHPIERIKYFFISLKWAYQRVKRGYCERDLSEVKDWFFEIMPEMLNEIKKEKSRIPMECYQEAIVAMGLDPVEYWDAYNIEVEELAVKKWDEILSQLAFLLGEATYDTCTKKNPFEDEFHRIRKEFKAKYGEFGEKLMTKEEKKRAKKGLQKWYFPSDIPEYKEVYESYFDEEEKLAEYRQKCAKEGLELFVKWFYRLTV